MVTIIGMCVVMNAASFIIHKMGGNNEYDGEWQKVNLVMMPYLLRNQEQKACGKHEQGDRAMVMPAVSMPKRVYTYQKRQQNHKVLKRHVVHEVNA